MLSASGDAPSDTDLVRLDAYWRPANCPSVGQIYLLDNRCRVSRRFPSNVVDAPAAAQRASARHARR
jgi:phosphoketolase